MKAMSSLVQLNLHCCRIRCEGITDLLTSTMLEVINLSGNKMQTLNMLPKRAHLRCLDLTSCSLSAPGLLCKSTRDLASFCCSSLNELRLANNTKIGDAAAGELRNVLAINVQLRVPDLMGCTLRGEALKKIFEGLTLCILLNELNLTGHGRRPWPRRSRECAQSAVWDRKERSQGAWVGIASTGETYLGLIRVRCFDFAVDSVGRALSSKLPTIWCRILRRRIWNGVGPSMQSDAHCLQQRGNSRTLVGRARMAKKVRSTLNVKPWQTWAGQLVFSFWGWAAANDSRLSAKAYSFASQSLTCGNVFIWLHIILTTYLLSSNSTFRNLYYRKLWHAWTIFRICLWIY